jgi:hypothetical protein
MVNEFQPRVMEIAKELLTLFAEIKNSIAIANAKIINYHHHVEQEHARLRAEESNLESTNLDKLVPFVGNDGWDINCKVTILMYKPNTTSQGDIFNAVESNQPFDSIADLVQLDLHLKLMKKPFGQGTFRYAYYALDPVTKTRVSFSFLNACSMR